MSTAFAAQPQKRKGLLGNEKGLTLIELLAVIVILAIIAAIAIPSIGGIINRTKKESHRANAQMIVDAARYAVTAEGFPMVGITNITKDHTLTDGTDSYTTDYFEVTVDELNQKGYLENVPKDPEDSDKRTYSTNSKVRVHKIQDSGKYRYEVLLLHADGAKVFNTTDGYVLETEIKTTPLAGDQKTQNPNP